MPTGSIANPDGAPRPSSCTGALDERALLALSQISVEVQMSAGTI